MEKILIANLILFIIVYSISTIIGLNLKKWYSWLVGLYGFITGCSIGFIVDKPSPSWEGGLAFAFIVISSGAVTRQQRLHYSRAAEEWLTRYGQDKRYSWLARIIERLTLK